MGISVALKSDGTLWTWGSGRGVLADGDASGWVPKQIGVDTDWWAIAAGGLGGLATKANGELWGWGNVGATHAPAKPLTEIGDSYGWTTIALSSNDDLAKGGGEENHAMAINTAGDLYTWGSSAQGQLGRDRAYVKEPARITQFE